MKIDFYLTLHIPTLHKMNNRYKKSIKSLIDQLLIIRVDPYVDTNKWLKFQIALMKKTFYIESQYRLQKNEIKELNIYRKNPTSKIDKVESLKIKEVIKRKESRIEDYKLILEIYKSIGDCIPFTFISKWDLKPQNFKESPGFMSQKTGIVNEMKSLRFAYKNNIIGILNDLTSVLKYSDITLVREHCTPIALEIKSSSFENQRILRQQEKTHKLFQYLSDDKTNQLYGKELNFVRIDLETPELNYIDKINSLVSEAKENGTSHILIEDGLIYVISYNKFSEETYNTIFQEHKFKNPITCFLLKEDIFHKAYHPLILILNNSQYFWDFMSGKISIMVMYDLDLIKDIALKNNYDFELIDDAEYIMQFNRTNEVEYFEGFKMSYHYFGRIFYEFISPKWLLENNFKMMRGFKDEVGNDEKVKSDNYFIKKY
ncbi:hypothetical protein [Flavobacterium sp. 3HN19-14]|uniref:hypothetical protein n=1 Tax=Flavobacterium sp. 3HN19-14 TaxID=3448133 RepID=UPI003EE1FB3F